VRYGLCRDIDDFVEIRVDDTIVLANWKMNKTLEEAKSFFGDLLDLFGAERYLKIVICVPYPYVGYLSSMCQNTNIEVGAQNLFYKEWGKYTGEVSAPMLASVGCRYVMLGHSFRRKAFSESDESIKSRMLLALKHEIIPIICLGETIEEKRSGRMYEVLDRQVKVCLNELHTEKDCWICYEPRWAIGSGITPEFEEISDAHTRIREFLQEYYSRELAAKIPIIYGGSVKPENVFSIYSQKEVDGVGFGGCSLDFRCFKNAIEEAVRARLNRLDK